jgi:hypothetical protein
MPVREHTSDTSVDASWHRRFSYVLGIWSGFHTMIRYTLYTRPLKVEILSVARLYLPTVTPLSLSCHHPNNWLVTVVSTQPKHIRPTV